MIDEIIGAGVDKCVDAHAGDTETTQNRKRISCPPRRASLDESITSECQGCFETGENPHSTPVLAPGSGATAPFLRGLSVLH